MLNRLDYLNIPNIEADDIYSSWRNIINTDTSEGRAAVDARKIEVATDTCGVINLFRVMGFVLERRFNKT